MNPEFRRQLWLQFSPARLVLMPALLILGSVAVALSANEDNLMEALAGAVLSAFFLIVYGMGTNAAGASILEEIQERTWDQQRMSAMQPWTMTWGKLFGATSYAWYGGALCLFVFLPSALAAHWHHAGEIVLCAVLGGVLLHAMLFSINLQLGRSPGKLAQRGGIWVMLVLMLWGTSFGFSFSRNRALTWWGTDYEAWDFLLGSLLVFTPCLLAAAWRLMADNLAVRQYPWAWPAWVILLTLYVGGFSSMSLPSLSLVGLGIAALLTYASLLSQAQVRVLWQRMLGLAADGQWRSALLQVPPWLTSLLLVLVFAVLGTLDNRNAGQGELVEIVRFRAHLPLVIALLVLRDCCLLLFFSFNPESRRPQGAFMLTLFLLYVLLPWLFSAMDAGPLSMLVSPLGSESAAAGAIAVVHAAIAGLLLRWQWQRTAPDIPGQ